MDSEKNNNEIVPESGLEAPALEARPKPRWFAQAVTISVMFHLALAVSVMMLRLGPDIIRAQAIPAGIVVAVLRREQRTESSSAAIQQPQTATAIPTAPAPQPAPRSAPAEHAARSTTPAEAATDNAAVATAASVPVDETPASSNAGTINVVALQRSITSYVETWNSQQLTNWIDECQRFRNRYFTQDCTLDPSVRTGNPDIPLSSLLPMIEDDSPLGELARERHALVVAPRDFLANPIIKSRYDQLVGPKIALLRFGPDGPYGLLVDNWVTQGVLSALDVVTDPLQAPSFVKPVDVLTDEAVAEQDDAGLAEFERTPSIFSGSD
jgi:hypothetical protein